MQDEDVIVTKGYYRGGSRIQNDIQARMSPSSHVNNGQAKLSHSPGHWKKYITNESNIRSPRRQPNTNYTNNSNGQQVMAFADRQLRRNNKASDSRSSLIQPQIPHINNNKMDQQRRRKQQMMRRVQQIQKKVMPILKSHRNNNQQIDDNYVWHNKMQQRILKLETNIDMIQKQMQIKLQRRIIQVEKQWKAKFQSLLQQYSGNQSQKIMGKKTINNSKIDRNQHQYSQNEHDVIKNGKNHQNLVNNYENQQNLIDQEEDIEGDQGYFTRRENWMQDGEEQEQQNKVQYRNTSKKYELNKK